MTEQNYLLDLYLFDHQHRVLLPTLRNSHTAPIVCIPNEDEKYVSSLFNTTLWRVLRETWGVSDDGISYLMARPSVTLNIFGVFIDNATNRTLIHSIAISLCRDIESKNASLYFPSLTQDKTNWYNIFSPPQNIANHVRENLKTINCKIRGRGSGREKVVSDMQQSLL